LKPVPAEHQAKARPEILNFLIDNLLIDQYLVQNKFDAPPAEVEVRLQRIKEEAAKGKREFAKLLEELMLTEADLRATLAADLRWENFIKTKASDAVLANIFTTNKDWFDGSQVRARHLLVSVPATADAPTRQAAQVKLANLQKEIEADIAKGMQTVDPRAESLIREQARVKIAIEAFGKVAERESDCPSKKNGGDLGWFPRIGSMVEPFAKAAFGLKLGEISPIVPTQFGYHLILATGRMPGKDVKFDDMKDEVREIYAERLREELVPQLRKSAKIELVEAKK
jgi:parvulin-like peptidyl-prolyl isomerase